MRLEDKQTVVVMMFETGMTPSQIEAKLDLPPGFARDAITYWWWIKKERNIDERDDGLI